MFIMYSIITQITWCISTGENIKNGLIDVHKGLMYVISGAILCHLKVHKYNIDWFIMSWCNHHQNTINRHVKRRNCLVLLKQKNTNKILLFVVNLKKRWVIGYCLTAINIRSIYNEEKVCLRNMLNFFHLNSFSTIK